MLRGRGGVTARAGHLGRTDAIHPLGTGTRARARVGGMPDRRTRVSDSPAAAPLAASLAALRRELKLPGRLPRRGRGRSRARPPHPIRLPQADLTDVPFLTIDPAGSTDLDQALHLARTHATGSASGTRSPMCPPSSRPDGAVDAEARRRGQTIYAPDGRVPLHPAAIGEDAGSLLPGSIAARSSGTSRSMPTATRRRRRVARARIRSRRQWSYEEAHAAIDDGTAPEELALLQATSARRGSRASGSAAAPA